MGRTKMTSKMAKQQGSSGKHFTKAELKKREKEEVILPDSELKPNDYLPEKFHKRFYWFVEQFKDFGILSNVDSDALSRYVMADEMYWEVTKVLNQMTCIDPEYPKIQAVQDKYFKQVQALALQMGMTMVSRSKLKREKTEDEEKELSMADQLFKEAMTDAQ